MDTTWKFDQPPNCAVFTLRSIAERGQPVLHVTHDADDGGWQFLGSDTPTTADMMIVSLRSVVAKDPTLLELAELPIGWHAWRRHVGDSWSKAQNHA